MKKLFMFLAVAGLATFGASCSSSDDNAPEQKQLTLSSDAKDNTVVEGTTVKFSAKVDGKEEAGAEFYVNDTKVSNPYKFDTEGSYKVVAKKDKFKPSAVMTITVTKDGQPPVEKRTLVLTADKEAVFVGGKVKFTVKDDLGAAVAGFKIKQVGGAEITGDEWTATAAGDFKFVASKDNYEGSNEVSVAVTVDPNALVLALVTNPDEVFAGSAMTVSLKDASGAKVAEAELFLNGTATGIKSNAEGLYVITPNIAGDYDLQAKKGNSVSNSLLVIVNEAPLPDTEIDGTFVYKGATTNVEEGAILLDGIYYTNDARTEVEAVWNLVAVGDDGKVSIVIFSTPASGNEEDGYAPALPTPTNASIDIVAVVDAQTGEPLDTAEEGTLSFGATPNENGTVFTGIVTAGATLGGQPFTLNLDGDLIFGRTQRSEGFAASKKSLTSKASKAKGVKRGFNLAKIAKSVR